MEAPGEKLIIKLWESIADKGIGSLLKPWQIRREGRASIDLKSGLLALKSWTITKGTLKCVPSSPSRQARCSKKSF